MRQNKDHDRGGNRNRGKQTDRQRKPTKRSFDIINLLSKVVKLAASIITLFKLIRSLLS